MIAAAALLLSGLAGDVVARLRAEPAQVEVGQPAAWVLEIEHPAGASVHLPEGDPLPDDSWVLLEPRRVVRGSGERSTTRATWRVMSLEPGKRKLPPIQIEVEEAGVTRKVEVEAGELDVRPALAEGEDAPRPIRSFRPPPEGAAGRTKGPVLLALVLIAAVAGFLLWRRARRKPAPASAPTALDRLAELERLAAEDPDRARVVVYALSRLLRGTVDAFFHEDRAALVDADWAALLELDERVPLGVRTAAARILSDAERVKYALQVPTRFALEEMLADARNALEALASAPPTAAPRQSPAEEAA